MVICLELDDKVLHTVKLMPLPPYHFLLKIQIGFYLHNAS